MSVGRAVLLLAGIYVFACTQSRVTSHDSDKDRAVGRIIVSQEKKNFLDLFELDGVVILETSDDSLVGRVKKVSCDAGGHIYLLDRRSSKKLFHFDNEGMFLNSYGEQGESPHGYSSLNDFALGKDCVYVLSGRKLLAFDKGGSFIRSVKLLPEYPSAIFYHAGHIMGFDPTGKKNVFVYAEDFTKIDSFGTFNTRFSNHDWRPRNAVAVAGDRVAVVNVFNTTLNFFSYGGEMNSVSLFADNPEVLELTKIPELRPEEESLLDSLTHSFSFVYAVGAFFLVEEFSSPDSFSRLHLVDSHDWRSSVMDDIYADEQRFFDYVVGSGGDYLFMVLESEETFAVFKSKFPTVELPDFDASKNPILLKMKIKEMI